MTTTFFACGQSRPAFRWSGVLISEPMTGTATIPSSDVRLVQLLHQAGAQPHRNTWIFFGSCAGQENFEAYVANLTKIIEEAGDDIAAMGVSRAAVRESLDALASW